LRNFEGRIKNVTISKTPSGKYFASFSVEDVVKVVKSSFKRVVGIDVNIENFLTDSNGVRIENPKFKNELLSRVKFYQKKISKSQKGSKNREYWRIKLNRVYEKINNRKHNFLHNLSKKYVKNQDVIIVENLKIKNMVRNSKLAESISNVSWGEFFRQLEYKSKWYGTRFIKIDPKFTSKTCSNCGLVNSELTLSEREWTCSGCQTLLNRDFNSAQNIKKKGISSVLKIYGEIDSSQFCEVDNCVEANVMLATI
jgi:putative transposase